MLQRLLSLFVGLAMGIASAVGFVTLFSPVSGEELRDNAKKHFKDALQAAQEASAAKRKQLEKELAEMQAE